MDGQAQQAQDAQVAFPADESVCKRALLVGNLNPAVNTDQACLLLPHLSRAMKQWGLLQLIAGMLCKSVLQKTCVSTLFRTELLTHHVF